MRACLRIAAPAAFVGLSLWTVEGRGLYISRDTVFVWLLLGLLALSITDLRRWVRGLVFDWLPLGIVLLFYDTSHAVSAWLGTRPHVTTQIQLDLWLFGSPVPTVRLQHWLHTVGEVGSWEYVLFGVYMSHFFATLVIAGLLWRFAYPRFRQFRAQVVCLTGLGFVTYVLFPAVPPWMAAHEHALPSVDRLVPDVWGDLGVRTARSVLENGSAFYNQVAAVPSMHAAYPMLFVLFFWGAAPKWLRATLFAYAAAMAFALVYSGEHYVFDILVGWTYAIATHTAAVGLRARRTRRARDAAAPIHRPHGRPLALRRRGRFQGLAPPAAVVASAGSIMPALRSRLSSFRGFARRVVLVCAGLAFSNLLLANIAVAAVGRGGRVRLVPGFDVVGVETSETLLSAAGPALAVGLALAVLAFWRVRARAALLWPACLLLGAGVAPLIDVVRDGRVTRWLDPPVLPPINMADIALALAALVLVHRLGMTLGGTIDDEAHERH